MLRRARARTSVILVCLVVWLLPALSRPILRADEGGTSTGPVVVGPQAYAESPPLSELPPSDEVKPAPPGDEKDVKERPIRSIRPVGVDAGPGSIDGAIQPPPAGSGILPEAVGAPVPGVSFEGLSSQDNQNLFGFRVLPPDTNGDVGPTQYVQIVNLAYRVFDKAGNPQTPALKISSIFSPLGTVCATRNDGDPIVLYDPLADRWLISQFCTVGNPNTHQLIAISKTGDAAGAYFLYDFMMPNLKFNDYPKFGVWPDAYYMSDNQFDQGLTQFLGAGVFAFNRVKMLAGDPTANYVYFDLAALDPSIGGILPADMDGLNPPPPGTPNYFVYFTADEFGDPSDALRVFGFHVDFTNPTFSAFNELAESPIAVPAFDPRSPGGRNDIEQPPPGISLDSIQDRLMYRLAYRNYGATESLVVNHTVNVGPSPGSPSGHQAAIRYYDLRRMFPAGSFAVSERATFAPDTSNRWMGSAATDSQGDLAVGYSVASSTIFPSIRFAGRLATDPPNGLFQGEVSLISGTGVQTHGSGRWGDYSALSVDPVDDCTFWYTQEYYTSASQATSPAGWLTRIGSFKFPNCITGPHGTLEGTVRDILTGVPVAGAAVQTDSGQSRLTDAAGAYSMPVIAGTVTVTASKAGFQTATVPGVVIEEDSTTVQDFNLTPIPNLVPAGAVVSGEDCVPASGGLDPGETVSVDLAIRNEGAFNTIALTGTLLPGGGVTAPGGPQSYGALAAGGPAVSRRFTFTVDPALGCAGSVTLVLHLTDGPADFGTLSYVIPVGNLSNGVFTSTYGSGDIAAAIPDLSAVDIPIPVPDDGVVADVNVRVRLDHTFVGDLVLTLIHPDGTGVNLVRNRGAGGDNFGTGANDCSGSHTGFDDSAVTPVATGTAPFAGTFQPDQPLSDFNGKGTAGVWTLRAHDTSGSDVGVVGCVEVEIGRRLPLCCPFAAGAAVVQAAPPVAIPNEGCSPGNGGVDPGETVTVSFPLTNVGLGPTGNLVATLLPGGGIGAPSGPQSYGSIGPSGPPVGRDFTFTAEGKCGGGITATLHLQDGPLDLGNVTFPLTLGSFVPGFQEHFDAVAAPALPAGWSAAVSGAAPPAPWATTTAPTFRVSPPNGAASGSSASVSEARLDSPVFTVPAGGESRLTFQHRYDLEPGFDGAVLEIRIGAGNYTDVLTAGGSFLSGGYNGIVDATFGNPLAGRPAWTGSSAGFVPVVVSLPAGAADQPIQLRWRSGFDSSISVSGGGWRLDDIVVATFNCCGPRVAAATPAPVTAESCGPANLAPDPDETVTVSFPLQNVGTVPTTHLMASLLAVGGVSQPGPSQDYGALAIGGAPVARSFSFVPGRTCGETVTATLHLTDGIIDLGEVTFDLPVGTTAAVTQTFANFSPIAIPSAGTAAPYPSSIQLSGITGTVEKVTVELLGLSHSFPDDLDLLLVGPGGRKLILMSDAGGNPDLVNVNLTLDQAAPLPLPDSTQIAAGSYRPTNYGSGDTFPAPAPGAPYPSPGPVGNATLDSVFNGIDPNGTWSLYLVDDLGGDSGSLDGGWRLHLTIRQPVCCTDACYLSCPGTLTVPSDPDQCGAAVGYSPALVEGICGRVEFTPPAGYLAVGPTSVIGTAYSALGGGVMGTCNFEVTVADTQPPSVSCPADITVANDAGLCSAAVEYSLSATDNCPGVTAAGNPPSGSAFPVGTTVVGAAALDAAGLTGGCGFSVTVRDNEAPALSVVLNPDRLWPPNHRMVDVTATVATPDNCGPTPFTLDGVASNEPDDSPGTGDGNTLLDIQGVTTGTPDTGFSLRAERSGGSGRFYTAAYSAVDGSGNVAQAFPTVFVALEQAGTADPIRLLVSPTAQGTLLRWDPVPGAQFYSVIRGSISELHEEAQFINLGSVTCLEAAATVPSTLGREDSQTPPVGEVYFYAVAYHDPLSSSYGSVSATKPRVVAAGECQ